MTDAPGWASTSPAWTRHGEAYEAFEGRLFVTGVCYSPQFVDAWTRFRAEREGWPAERRDATLLSEATEASRRLRFLVGVVAQDDRWDDAGPSSSLEFTLRVDGRVVAPASVRHLTDNELADLIPYFRWLTPLHTGYLVDFPPQATPQRLDLRVAGPPARIEMTWEIPR